MPALTINAIGRTYRHIKRYRQILTVLIKYGFENFVDSLNLEQYIEIGLNLISRKSREKLEVFTRAERIRMVMEELGPTFIKIGQILSTRTDLLPLDMINELSNLQDKIAPFPFEEVMRIIADEIAPIDEIFSSFSEEPLAAASIGQVHRARLKTGEEVVVKVRRPNVERTVEIDLEILLHIATLMENHLEGWDLHRPTLIVEEFTHTLERELDYLVEAAHMERFSQNFSDDESIYVPRVYREASSTRMLTMEFINGIKASEVNSLYRQGYDLGRLAKTGAKSIMKQVFIHGFFHADPHPGNIFILPNNVVCFLDFGMMGRLDRHTREQFANLLNAIVQRNEVRAMQTLLKLTFSENEPDLAKLQRDVAEFMDQYCYLPLKEFEVGRVLQQLMKLLSTHRLQIPPDIFLMIKALSTMEGLGRQLDPEFDITREAAPFLWRIQFERVHPSRIWRDAVESSSELAYLIKEIPGELRELIKQLRQGKSQIQIKHTGMDPVLSTLDRVSNRLAFAIVLASLVIGSSLIILSGIPPTWHAIPIIGLIGYVVAGMMGFWLLWSILRGGMM